MTVQKESNSYEKGPGFINSVQLDLYTPHSWRVQPLPEHRRGRGDSCAQHSAASACQDSLSRPCSYSSSPAPQSSCGTAPARCAVVAHTALAKNPAPFLFLQNEGFLGRKKIHIFDKHKLLSLDKRLGEQKKYMNVYTPTIP